MPAKKELESRIAMLTGNMMGMQHLLLSVVATSNRRKEIADHLRHDAAVTMATMNAESTLSDETLAHFEHWVATTLELLTSDEAL